MEFLRQLLRWCCCIPIFRKKRSRYGYTIIREVKPSDSRRLSLLSTISQDRPIPNEVLEEIEDHKDEIIQCMKDLKTSRILLEIPALGRRLTNQLAEYSFQESGQYVNINLIGDEKEEILKENLVYLASHTNNVDKLASELLTRRVVTYTEYVVVSSFKNRLLKALEVLKLVLRQMDSLGFLIGALKVTGSDYVAEILLGNYFPEAGAELICRISLTPEYSPDFILHGQPTKYRYLYQIPHDRQDVLTSINCTYIETKAKTLLKSLEYAPNLTSITLKDVRLKKEFQRTISLPALKQFVLHLNQDFPTKKEFYDYITPKRVLSMLFFITDRNNNHNHRLGNSTDNLGFDFTDSNTTDRWNINDLWSLNIDISLKISGRTVLLIDHVKSRLFSRVENYYKIPENICQPQAVRNLKVGWCGISPSFIPLLVTRLHLYSIKLIKLGPNKPSKSREDLNIIIRNLASLRELKIWGDVAAEPYWPIIRFSSFPAKLKTLAASFVEIQIDIDDNHNTGEIASTSHSSNNSSSLTPWTSLENIYLFVYKITITNSTADNNNFENHSDKNENEKGDNKKEKINLGLKLKFLDVLSNCKKVSLVNIPPYQLPTQEELLHILQPGKVQQVLLSGCQHHLNFKEHFLYFKNELIQNIDKAESFFLTQEPVDRSHWVWTGRALCKEEIIQHLYFKFGFDELYSSDVFLNHEIIASLWKYIS